jgi:uncharacterized protein DUF1800
MARALPSDLSQVNPVEAWKPWQPAEGEWNRKWIAHLYRRAAFGPTPAEIEKAATDGLNKTLDHLMTGEPDAAERLELLTETGQFYNEPVNLRVWWLYAMLEGGHPLREKLTLFWHNHFATSYAKVRSTKLMYEQNVTLRKHALGRFRPFLLDMSKDTAMLVWLDSNRNVKGAPNENYAREVMELFSLGVGNYTEKDVQEAARAFTGWHHDAEGNKFENIPVLHDDGEKTVLNRTGKWNGADIVRICCDQPACAKFLVGKLYTYLVSETAPPRGLLDPLVASLRKSDYDIALLARTMLASQLFFSEHAYRKCVKWPVEYALGAARAATPGRVPMADLVDPLAKMGQVLFNPPNVKGWRTGTDWLNSATLLARNNFAEVVAMGEWSRQGVARPRGNRFAQFAEVTEPKAPKGPTSTPPPPQPGQDPVAAIYAAKPKDIAEVVRAMGDLVYGQEISSEQAAKLVKFLNEPGPPPGQPAPPPSKGGPPGGSESIPGEPAPPPTAKTESKAESKADDVPGKAKDEAKKTEPKKTEPKKTEPKKPYKPDIASDEFKARVREALHAMMCLPEYQLN